MFGYQKYQNQWHAYVMLMLRSGMVWHEKFGWIEKAHLPRYAAGERIWALPGSMPPTTPCSRRDIGRLDIETEHYRIRTNHSIEAAVAIGTELENLHRLWRQISWVTTPPRPTFRLLFFFLLPSLTGRGAGGEGRP